jgi:very-short-patch-repair endonuclease
VEFSKDKRLALLARSQHGLFTRAQCDEIGFTPDQREFRARMGRWVVLYDGVYRIAGLPDSWPATVLAACWATKGLAVASHRSAAALWDLPGGHTDLVEISCRRKRRTRTPGLVVHETDLLRELDIVTVDGIPATSVEQTLLGLAAVSGQVITEMALDKALRLRLTTAHRLEEFVQHKGKRGRNGIGVLRALVSGLDPLVGLPESVMETKLKQLLRRHGLPSPVFQYEIRDQDRFVARVDAAYPEHRIAIEYDSYEHHTGKLAIVRDNDRRNRIRRARWRYVVFTAADIRRDGGEALATLRSELRSGAPQP